MLIRCNQCAGKSHIFRRENITPDYTKLTCRCNDPHCGHTFIMELTFSHTLSPSASQLDRIFFERLQSMPAENKKNVIRRLQTLLDSPQQKLI